MRKSFTGGGRPSLSGAPSRVRHEESASSSHRNRPSSLERGSLGSKLPVSRKSLLGSARKSSAGPSSTQQYRPRQSSVGRGSQGDQRRLQSGTFGSLSQNSFVPTTGRPSSGIGVRGRTDVPKDTRPVSNRQYQSQCISNLLEFLTTKRYPNPISHKILGSPTNKDFFTIFEFIMGHLWEGYKQAPKMQEEVPRMLKLLGYPFNLPKTYLCSVGSPHTWPYLLAALNWMIEQVQIMHSGDPIEDHMFDQTGDDFEGTPDEKILFDFKEATFRAFLTGSDDYTQEEIEALERRLMEKHHGGNIDDIIEENRRLEAMAEDRDKEEEKMRGLREQSHQLDQAGKSVLEYRQNIQRHKQAIEAEVEKRQEELQILKADLEKEESMLRKLQLQYEQQDLKPVDVDRMKAEQEHLQAQVDLEEKRLTDISTEKWQINMDQAKLNAKLEEEVVKYNRLAINLKLVPESAEFAEGKDFRLRVGFSSDVAMDFHNTIKPKMTLMKKKLNEDHRVGKKEKFRLHCDIEKMQETLNEKRQKLEMQEKELAKVEADIEELLQAANSGHQSEYEKLSSLKREVSQLEASLNDAKAERERAAKDLDAVQKSYQTKAKQAQQEVAKMREIKRTMVAKVEEHTEYAKKKLRGVLKLMEEADARETAELARIQQASDKMRKKYGLPPRAPLKQIQQ